MARIAFTSSPFAARIPFRMRGPATRGASISLSSTTRTESRRPDYLRETLLLKIARKSHVSELHILQPRDWCELEIAVTALSEVYHDVYWWRLDAKERQPARLMPAGA